MNLENNNFDFNVTFEISDFPDDFENFPDEIINMSRNSKYTKTTNKIVDVDNLQITTSNLLSELLQGEDSSISEILKSSVPELLKSSVPELLSQGTPELLKSSVPELLKSSLQELYKINSLNKSQELHSLNKSINKSQELPNKSINKSQEIDKETYLDFSYFLDFYMGEEILYKGMIHRWSKKDRKYLPVMINNFLYIGDFCIRGELIYRWVKYYKQYLPIANSRYVKVGHFAIFNGYVCNWHNRENMLSGYSKNGVNYKI